MLAQGPDYLTLSILEMSTMLTMHGIISNYLGHVFVSYLLNGNLE